MIRLKFGAPARALASAAVAALLAACGSDAAPAAEQLARDAETSGLAEAPDPVVVEVQAGGAPTRVVLHGVDLTGVSERALQKMGFRAQVPESLEEYYQPPEKRKFRQKTE